MLGRISLADDAESDLSIACSYQFGCDQVVQRWSQKAEKSSRFQTRRTFLFWASRA